MDTLVKTLFIPEPPTTPGSSRRPPRRTAPAESDVTSPAPPELQRLSSRDGHDLILREIGPGDMTALQRGFARLTPDEVRMRFLHPLTELPDEQAMRLCNLDPDRAVAFVLADPPATPQPEIHAVARAHIDPVTLCAEFALVVQGRHAGQGYGTLLMRHLIDACRRRGTVEIWGDVLYSNSSMLELCDHLGFRRHLQWNDPGIVRVTLDLSEATAA